MYHSSGRKVLVVKRPEDRPEKWEYAIAVSETDKSWLTFKTALEVPLTHWKKRQGVYIQSGFLKGNACALDHPVEIRAISAYLYIIS